MKIIINKEKCIGCGTCVGICPQVFELGADGKAELKVGSKPEEFEDKVNEAAEACSTQAITVE